MRIQKNLRVMAALGMLVSTVQRTAESGEPHGAIRHNIPPAQRLLEQGPMVGGPGPGVLTPETIPAGNCAGVGGIAAPAVQVIFNEPISMQVLYDVVGDNTFTSDPLVVPGRLEFGAGGIYRLKLTNIKGREGVELYPTVEIAGGTARTAAYLAHNAIPIQFSDEDFEQALAGNFVTKVIYLPNPEFQGDALAGIDTLVSTRLEPGCDPIVEADRRGSILAIIRLGNKDIELSGPSVGGGMVAGMVGGVCGPDGAPLGGPYGNPPNMVAGVTAPQYGMTYSGTPIGLAGPPHIPLGGPAGLQKHVIRNHTQMNIPDPVSTMKMHVRQVPGQSYPQPASRVHIREQNLHPGYANGRPPQFHANQSVPGDQYRTGMAPGGADCPPGMIR